MKGKERILLAMNMKQGDRVPLMCQFSIGCMMNQLHPDPVRFWYDRSTFEKGLISLCKEMKFDGILVSLHGHSDVWKEGLIKEEKIEEGKTKLYYPDRVETHSWEDLPLVEFYESPVLKSIDDIDIDTDIPEELDYIPVSNNLHFSLDKSNMHQIFYDLSNEIGDEYSLHGEITSPFDYFLDKLTYQEGLLALLLNPDKCKLMLQKYTNGVIKIAEGMCKCPIDAIKISSPFAGQGFISTEMYEEFVLPYESQIVKTIKDAGKKVYIHTCGHIGDRLELMKASGASGLECLDPAPVGNVDIEDAFKRIGDTMFIKGNIDSINTLLFGDDQKVREDVSRIIKVGRKKGQGFILSTACSIAPNVPKKHLLMLSDLIQEFGLYE